MHESIRLANIILHFLSFNWVQMPWHVEASQKYAYYIHARSLVQETSQHRLNEPRSLNNSL